MKQRQREKNLYQIIRITDEEAHLLQDLLYWRREGQKPIMKAEPAVKIPALSWPGFYVYGAWSKEGLWGYVTAACIPKPDPRGACLYIDELWVAKPHRRQGIARNLLIRVQELGRDLGVWRLRLLVGKENMEARSLYRDLGFLEAGDCVFCEMMMDGNR